MNEIGPLRIINPEGRGAARTKMPLATAFFAMTLIVLDLRMEDADGLFAFDFQRSVVAHQVDGKAAAARRLAAN